MPPVKLIESAEDAGKACFAVIAKILFRFDVIQKAGDETSDEHFIWVLEGLSPVGDEFGDDAIVLSAAGFGAMFPEVISFAADANESPASSFMKAIFWELLAIICHDFLKIKV